MSQSKFEDALLRHARTNRVGEGPDPARRRAAKAAFLATATIAAAGTTAGTATAATVKGAASASAASASAASTGLTAPALVKLAIAIAVGSGGVAGVVAVTSHAPSSPPAVVRAAPSEERALPPSMRPIMTAAPPSSAVATAIADLPNEAPALPASALPESPPKRIANVAIAPLGPGSAVAPEDSLLTEARLLEAARACLGQDDLACAEARIAEHAKRFGTRGALADEASILAIDTAKKRGDRVTAKARARAFLADRPNSPYVPRVRAVLASLEETGR